MIQLGSGYEKVCEYLQKHDLNSLEEIVGMNVYHVFNAKGVSRRTISSIKFSEDARCWCFQTNSTYRLMDLGESIFLDEREAKEYEIARLQQLTLEQRKYVVNMKIEERNRDLNKLEFLLKRYPTPESRCRFKKRCEKCLHHKDGIIEERVTCDEFGKPGNCYFWQPDVEIFQKWLEEHKVG